MSEAADSNVRRLVVVSNRLPVVLTKGATIPTMLNSPAPVEIQVRLKRPVISVDTCIGCGICEHECPVSGKRAIRVSAENESRDKGHPLVPGGRFKV